MTDRWDRVFAWLSQDFPRTLRAVSKWYFDLIKNAFVVVALMLTVRKTGGATVEPAASLTLKVVRALTTKPVTVMTVRAVAALTIGMFVVYTLSYAYTAFSAINSYGESHSPLLSILITLLGGVIMLVVMAAVGLATFDVILALFRVQLAIK